MIQSLSDMKFPSYMEKYIQADSAKKELSLQIPNYGNPEKNFSSWLGANRYESNVPTGLLDVDVSIMSLKIYLEKLSCLAFVLFPFVVGYAQITTAQNDHRCSSSFI